MKLISTKNLENLTDIDGLKRLLQSLAVLDLIMSPDDWDSRYYSFDAHWAEGETMGSMRNGCGDSFNAWFDENGCFFKGFAHEYPLSSWDDKNSTKWKTVLEKVPSEFAAAVGEPAFDMGSISFCFWCHQGDKSWHSSSITADGADKWEDPDGSLFLLECLNGDPNVYQKFVEEYYEEDISMASIRQVYSHTPLTQNMIDLINPQVLLKDIEDELLAIGYPVEGKNMTDATRLH